MKEILDFTTPQDSYYNYCWWPYRPIADPAGKLRPSTLLNLSYELAGVGEEARPVVQAMQRELGLFRTVYGVKWMENRLSWEYYLYDYKREHRQVSLTRVFQALRPWMDCEIPFPEADPYFMFSFDHRPGERPMPAVNVYIGNPGSTVSSGISYVAAKEGMSLENLYFFFDAHKQLNNAADKIICSVFSGAGKLALDEILRPELRECHTICVANKRRHDTVYFSGINVRQLRFFLTMLRYPDSLRAFVDENQSKLDHLLFDAGFDYRVEGGALKIVKSGFYGVF